MIINTAITTQVATKVLQTLCSDFMEAIKGKAYKFGESSAQNAQIDQKITELAEFFTGFEADTTTLFLSDLQAAFSKENIIKILKEIREEESFDLEAALYNKLTELCQVYKIIDDGDRIIASIIELYFQLTSVGDPDLANRLFFHRLYKQGNAMMGMLVRLDARTEQILANQHSYEMQTNNSSSFFSDSESGTIVGSDDDMFTWELNSQQTRGLFASQEKRKKEVSELIRHWRNERLKYPGWYIAPVGKRETLLAYTRDEELLWNTNDLSIQEQLDFSYELIWRYETGMIIFNQYLQKNIYKIWKTYFEINDFSNRTNNEYWFYIGQALLRDYREDMNWEKWDEIFHILFDKHDILSNGKYELKWEFIKQLFFRMQITDVRDKLQQYKCPKDLYGIRLQKYGLMAECGLLHTAYLEIKQLIDDLNEAFSIVKEENTQEKVYIGSLISCAYDLFSLVIQGLHPFERSEELKESWKNQKIFEKFFDFEHEKYQWNNNLYNYCCKHNEIPFELNENPNPPAMLGRME
ncbi:MAG: hypothetical protein SOW08_12485 [Lachnospiraceae bacterium]|nr:hypothetical protein [Lachnospiraceae bacterium]